MKKLVFIIGLSLLAACKSSNLYYPYVGEKYIIGQGGFIQYYYSAKDMDLERELPDAVVGFWSSGLPYGQRCQLLGYAQNSNRYYLAQTIAKIGGNTATQSDVSFPVAFEHNAGMLNAYENAGNVTVHTFTNTSASSTTFYGYNVFYCE